MQITVCTLTRRQSLMGVILVPGLTKLCPGGKSRKTQHLLRYGVVSHGVRIVFFVFDKKQYSYKLQQKQYSYKLAKLERDSGSEMIKLFFWIWTRTQLFKASLA